MRPPPLPPRLASAAAGLAERLGDLDRLTVMGAAVAASAGLVVFGIATALFPYHSLNHDEGVYLLQAAMLLEGQLELTVGELAGAVRPWFFVQEGGRLYAKYTPVPAAMYAVSMGLFGEPRVTLAAVAAVNAGLVYALGAMVFDRRVGVVAAILFGASPLALVTTAVFLPYAPTTCLTLSFAVAYLYGVRAASLPAAGVAGVAIGLAFFARPFTAVLFALPFVLHALYRIGTAWAERDRSGLPEPLARHGLTALFGLLFVGVTLAYNLRVTGALSVFPYEAFAPLDGPGFGRREILAHSVEYTPQLALGANARVLWIFGTRWFTAGPLGTVLAAAGVAYATVRWRRGSGALPRRTAGRLEPTGGALLAALFITVSAGNVLFWGNYNILGAFGDPTDGLIAHVGPIYHFDLLAPLSVFAAVAIVAGGQFLAERLGAVQGLVSRRGAVIVVLVTTVLVLGAANATALAAPIERNAAVTENYEQAYEPIESTAVENGLVFLPTPYGEWQQHPFQYLRNDPDLDGPVVYALDREPAEDFAVIDAYPDRAYYRYSYRGRWSAAGDAVRPKLESLAVRSGPELAGDTTVGVPARVTHARVRLRTGADEHVEYAIESPGDSIDVGWSLDPEAARLAAAGPSGTVPVTDSDEVVLTVTLVQPDGGTLTYRQEVTVRTESERVQAIWPPEREVCPLVTDCGTDGTYLPEAPDAHRDGVFFETQLERIG